MTLKMTFLGSGSAFTVGNDNFQSNILLETNGDSLLIDAGTDIRFSLNEIGKNYLNIKNVYISHVHSDHVGGLEWLALCSFFDPEYKNKPILFAPEKVIENLWEHSLSAGLSTLPNQKASLQTYFTVDAIDKKEQFLWQNIPFQLVEMIHVFNDYELMPCYGLFFSYHNKKILFTSDTQYVPDHLLKFYQEADIIFHDCETSTLRSGVHAHFLDLLTLPTEFKSKMWLYHYNPGPLPDAQKEGFQGFIKRGQTFVF